MLFPVYFLAIFSFVKSSSIPKDLLLGIVGPKLTASGKISLNGSHAIAALIMAINEINNKTDGIEDSILPRTHIKFAFESPRSNYLSGLSSAMSLSSEVFNRTGVVGVIGAASDASSTALAQVFAQAEYKIPQISYGACTSALAHKDLYPYFLRTSFSDAHEGRVLANFATYFHWNTVTVFYSGDTYGNDIMLEFEDQAKINGMTVEAKYSFWSGTEDLSSVIQQAIDNGGVLKIFVLLMKGYDAGHLLEQGSAMGLFKEGTQVLGTRYSSTPDTWAVMSSKANIPKIMKGFIGVEPSMTTSRKSINFQRFVKRFRRQKNTITTDSNGMIVCDQSKDDTNGQFLYKDRLTPTSPWICSGLEFDQFAEDGSDIDSLAAFAYDAMYAMAYALDTLINQGVDLRNVTGDEIKWALINNVSFAGATGEVSFKRGGAGVEAYAEGNRAGLMEYHIVNFNPVQFHKYVGNGASALLHTGTWISPIFTPCDMNYDSSCSAFVFNTADNSVPLDIAPIVIVQMSDFAKSGLLAGAIVALFIDVFFLCMVYSCQHIRLIKAAQPAMLYMILYGALLACVRVIVATFDASNVTCVLGKWLGHIAFALVFCAMILKTWRVDNVVNSGFKKVKITVKDLHRLMIVAMLLFCVYLTFDTMVAKPHVGFDESFDGRNTIRLMKCTNENTYPTMALYCIEALILILGGKLCWSTKDVPDAVNDSRFIAISMYLIVFVCAVTFPIVYLSIDPKPATLLLIMAVGFIVATVGTLLVLFMPKLQLLWIGSDVDENFKIVHSKDASKASNPMQSMNLKIKSSLNKISSRGPVSSMNATDSTIVVPMLPSELLPKWKTSELSAVPEKKEKSHHSSVQSVSPETGASSATFQSKKGAKFPPGKPSPAHWKQGEVLESLEQKTECDEEV